VLVAYCLLFIAYCINKVLVIYHAHIKLIPLHGTKNINKWQPTIGYLDKYFKKYEGYLSSHDSKRKSDKELEKIARRLRN